MASEPYRDPSATVSASRSRTVTAGTAFEICRSLYVGTGGDLVVTMAEGGDQLFKNVPSGCVMPLQVRGIVTAGTNAADFVALY